MRRHTTAKALVDASYNRYSFNDDYLPKWFAVDEQRHFRPQLPITRAEVDEVRRLCRVVTCDSRDCCLTTFSALVYHNPLPPPNAPGRSSATSVTSRRAQCTRWLRHARASAVA